MGDERPHAACLVFKGDTIDTVKQRYGLTVDAKKLDRFTPAGTAFQYSFDRDGIWIFFDERMRVLALRFDAPFKGTIYGILVGDGVDRLHAAKGLPASEFKGYPIQVNSAGAALKFTTAWIYDPGMPTFVRYDVSDGKVRSIIVESFPP